MRILIIEASDLSQHVQAVVVGKRSSTTFLPRTLFLSMLSERFRGEKPTVRTIFFMQLL